MSCTLLHKSDQQLSTAGRENFIFFHCPLDGVRFKVLVRVIFTIQDSGEVMLLHAFIKRQKRDTMQALEQSIRILADLREHPEYAVEFKIKEETG